MASYPRIPWTLSLLLVMLQMSLFASPAAAGPWEGYGRTYPVPRYELDPGADAQYRFASERSFPPYRDPPFAQAVDLPNPLDEPAFRSYEVIVVVNKQDHAFWGRPETLRVYQRGSGLLYYWLISSGHAGWGTPSGYFVPTGFSSRHWSGAFDAPMLSSVFFHGGNALHSSLDRDALGDLGRPASHGCIHIEEHRAEALFHLIGRSGYGPVDKLDPATGRPVTDANGQIETIEASKTLIIVGPVTPFGTTALAD
jgi:hypothetical protein